MTIRQLARRGAHAIRLQPPPPDPGAIMESLRIDSRERDVLASRTPGALAEIFFRHRGRVIHKWVHFLETYERYFAQYRNTPVKMLEIGVFKGGSLEMWREYFGEAATIYGIDINPDCAGYVSAPNQVRIGSQDDPQFLKSVIGEMGAPDIILDDGSHVGIHQRKSFDILFPLLKEGGLYAIEDLHTSYWPEVYAGGYRRAGTGIEQIKQMIDDMHAWYHNTPTKTPAKTDIGSIHIHDSVVFIEKRRRDRPGHIQVG